MMWVNELKNLARDFKVQNFHQKWQCSPHIINMTEILFNQDMHIIRPTHQNAIKVHLLAHARFDGAC